MWRTARVHVCWVHTRGTWSWPLAKHVVIWLKLLSNISVLYAVDSFLKLNSYIDINTLYICSISFSCSINNWFNFNYWAWCHKLVSTNFRQNSIAFFPAKIASTCILSVFHDMLLFKWISSFFIFVSVCLSFCCCIQSKFVCTGYYM